VKVITVGRKSLTGTVVENVLEHGCGALNIDLCRIRANGEVITNPSRGSESAKSKGIYGNSSAQETHQTPGQQIGRWPANLILQHVEGCHSIGGEAVWDCAPDCPVPGLDVQSGETFSSGGRAYQNTNDMYSGGWAKQDSGLPIDPGYGDKGGASRYFKQVTQMDELTQYLHDMIHPAPLGDEANTLVAMDLDTVDWESLPDESVHGLITQGKADKHLDQIWRVLKPGAHVMLIAPDDEPVGYVGACNLENHGFEIRDAIMVVDEPGKMHYVPKAAKKERNAGCEHLAARRKGTPVYDLIEEVQEDPDRLDEVLTALAEHGVEEEVLDNLTTNGIPKDLIPKPLRGSFVKRDVNAKNGNIHPTLKPKDIMVRLLSDIPTDHIVVDPFMGSGSTGIACLETGHSFIGIEREQEYLEIADARVRYWNTAYTAWNAATIESDLKVEDESVEMHGGVFDLF
jgi:DNA modification methylase